MDKSLLKPGEIQLAGMDFILRVTDPVLQLNNGLGLLYICVVSFMLEKKASIYYIVRFLSFCHR